MVNSKKGAEYFERIKPRINFVEVPFESILAGNPALVRPLEAPIVDREHFFDDVDKMTFTQLAEKYINVPNKTKMSWKRYFKSPYRKCKSLYKYAIRSDFFYD